MAIWTLCLWHKQQNVLHPRYLRITRKWIYFKLMILVSLSWIGSPSTRSMGLNDGDCELCNSSSNTGQLRESQKLGHSLGFMCVCVWLCECVHVCLCLCMYMCAVCMCVSMCRTRALSISPNDGEIVPSTTVTAPTRMMAILGHWHAQHTCTRAHS